MENSNNTNESINDSIAADIESMLGAFNSGMSSASEGGDDNSTDGQQGNNNTTITDDNDSGTTNDSDNVNSDDDVDSDGDGDKSGENDADIDDETEDEKGSEQEDEGSGEGSQDGSKQTDNETEEDEDFDWRRVVNELAKEKLEGGKSQKVVDKEEESKGTDETTKRMILPSEFNISEDEFDAALESKDGFEAVLRKVDDVFATRMEHLIKAIPEVIKGIAEETISTRLAISDFFQMNKDLAPYREVVMMTVDKLSAKYPDKDISSLMEDTGKEVRRILRLDKRKTMKTVRKRTPGIVNTGTSSRQSKREELTGMQKEISEMLKLG